MHEDQLVVVGRKTIINDDILPLAVLPELEVEDAGVFIVEGLVWGHYAVQQLLVLAQTSNGSQEPAVTWK